MIFRAKQVEPLMADRFKVRFQSKRDTGACAVREWSRLDSGTCPLIKRDCASAPEQIRYRGLKMECLLVSSFYPRLPPRGIRFPWEIKEKMSIYYFNVHN